MDAFNDKLVFLFMSYKEPFYAVILNLVLLHCLCNGGCGAPILTRPLKWLCH